MGWIIVNITTYKRIPNTPYVKYASQAQKYIENNLGNSPFLTPHEVG